ncbi:permease [Paenibacillus arenilitoris]|uniref:Permease n=1 Tax=Paenibacillus arenilitoris TaxID=2772299 RepID=A0A927H4N4_9BACL|nr:permease [Paenibacillus arenilitoris]MBD2868070.1 permease [Paenibacillus arenilitoris]
MLKLLFRFGTPSLAVGCLIMLGLIVKNRDWPSHLFTPANLQSFKILFISIILEAFPFILLGVLFSALLQVFVTDELIRKFTPKNPVAGVLFGALLGIAFPLCECGMIPVVRRLIRKGMPAYIGIVYLLAGPIVNPIVYTSTFTAFRTTPEMAYSRMGLAFAVSVVIGLLLYAFMKKSPLKAAPAFHVLPHRGHGHNHDHDHDHGSLGKGFRGRVASVLSHASDEFFDMGKYLIFGALLTAIIQTVIERSALESFADQPLLAYLFMMAFAFILSICSTSDAFIASSLSGMFDFGPLLAFLVFGPMIDLKNTLMLLSTFRVKFVLALIALTAVLTFIGAWLTEVLL